MDDPRLRRFVSGDLSEVEIAELESELERNSALRLALAELARTTDDPTGDAVVDGPERLIVGPTLGEGGMATVRHGVQTNLGRPVAVKTLRRESPSGTIRLLQEARLTARLQHPNIVPVHEVIEGRSGELQVVLKQVDGQLWSSVMHRPDILRARLGVADALDWNLGVLVALCNALAYAHEHGIIHRDLKPSNVMVGRFGEVYLLDWGIAAAWGEQGDRDVAHVADAPTAGTRAYMAPEQLEGEPEALGPWTDVYLLGGTLYELLSGRPPHADAASRENRRRPRERVVAPLGSDVPRELVAIVGEAMAPNPEERLLSVEEFRSRIVAYRLHRSSLELVERADRNVTAARAARGTGDAVAVERLLREAEFGFRAGLDAWAENARAREGIRIVAVERVEVALETGDLDGARRLLGELEEPPAALVERVRLVGAADEARRANAIRTGWMQDAARGVNARTVLLAAFTPFWVLGWLAIAIWPPSSYWPFALMLGGFLALGTISVFGRGFDLLQNHANKVIVISTGIALGGGVMWILGAAALELPIVAAPLGALLVFGLVLLVVGLTSDRRALPLAILKVAGFLAIAAVPSAANVVAFVCAALLSAGLVRNNLILRRRARELERSAARP